MESNGRHHMDLTNTEVKMSRVRKKKIKADNFIQKTWTFKKSRKHQHNLSLEIRRKRETWKMS